MQYIPKNFYIVLVIFLLVSIFPGTLLTAQETIEIKTYYPAPFGGYDSLVTRTLGVGDNNYDSKLAINDAPDPGSESNKGDVWISGNLGVNLDNNNLRAKLNVLGGLAIGKEAVNQTVPENSLYVEGPMGIGIDTPQGTLVVNNTIRLVPTDSPQERSVTGENPEGPEGGFYFDGSERKFKYHDGSGWKDVKASLQLGSMLEVENPNDLQKAPGSNELGVNQCSAFDESGCENRTNWPDNWAHCHCQKTLSQANTNTDFGGSTFAGSGPNNGNVVTCGPNEVMTGLRLVTAMHCDGSCSGDHVRVKRLVARCKPIE